MNRALEVYRAKAAKRHKLVKAIVDSMDASERQQYIEDQLDEFYRDNVDEFEERCKELGIE